MNETKELFNDFYFLKELEFKKIIYHRNDHPSLASAIVEANIPYKPGIYMVYGYTKNNTLGNLLYVGKAGADKNGKINAHQLPKRLLAVCYPPEKYLDKLCCKHPSRNEAWPTMMEHDNIDAIKIFCFFSKIKILSIFNNITQVLKFFLGYKVLRVGQFLK